MSILLYSAVSHCIGDITCILTWLKSFNTEIKDAFEVTEQKRALDKSRSWSRCPIL